MKRNRVIIWLAFNGGAAYVMWLALVEESVKAGNLLRFAIIAMFVISLLGSLSEEIKGNIQKQGRSVPAWVELAYDLFFTGFLATYGWFGYATIYMFTTVIQMSLYSAKEVEG